MKLQKERNSKQVALSSKQFLIHFNSYSLNGQEKIQLDQGERWSDRTLSCELQQKELGKAC